MIQPERTSDIFSLNKSDNSQYIHICIYVASEKWFNCLIQKLHMMIRYIWWYLIRHKSHLSCYTIKLRLSQNEFRKVHFKTLILITAINLQCHIHFPPIRSCRTKLRKCFCHTMPHVGGGGSILSSHPIPTLLVPFLGSEHF